jgi:hypothetical protein
MSLETPLCLSVLCFARDYLSLSRRVREKKIRNSSHRSRRKLRDENRRFDRKKPKSLLHDQTTSRTPAALSRNSSSISGCEEEEEEEEEEEDCGC